MTLVRAPRTVRGMNWHRDNDRIDPALIPLAEQALIRNATPSDARSSTVILLEPDRRDEDRVEAAFGEADEAIHPDA